MLRYDFIVIGAGIAGLAAAAALAGKGKGRGKVALLEREAQPCHHSSGRSAAIFVRSYGNDAVHALTAISERLFSAERDEGTFAALAPPRGILMVARVGGAAGAAAPGQIRLSAEEAKARVPLLRAEQLSHAWFEADAQDIDVHAMHMGYAKALKAGGGTLQNEFAVTQAEYSDGLWHVSDGRRTFSAPVVINAAGAWAEEVGALFGAAPKGMTPLRRSAALIDPPEGTAISNWPMVVDIDYSVYFKPEAGKLMVSPVDATPSPPCDCWADEMDIAVAIDRYQQIADHDVQRVSHTWAGLRNYVSDGCPLIGADPDVPGLFWQAALGGFGVQTAPATGALVAALASGDAMPEGVTPELLRAVSPERIANIDGGETACPRTAEKRRP